MRLESVPLFTKEMLYSLIGIMKGVIFFVTQALMAIHLSDEFYAS